MQTAFAQNYPLDNTIKVEATDSKDVIIEKAAHVIPTDNQLRALEEEFIAFIHFGPNTFTRMEWGTGKEDPSIFDLKTLDTDQWCKAIKAAGMKIINGKGQVTIETTEAARVAVYALTGAQVRQLDLVEGTNVVELPAGIYVIGHQKVVVF